MSTVVRKISLGAGVALVAGSCALPAPEYDVELGRQVAASTEADYGLYQDQAMQRYVAAVFERVVGQIGETPFEYRFAVLDQPEPNAFAAPGGFVYVSRGFLALARSEDELAGVLGHEIVHVEQRHAARANRPRLLGSILTLPGRVVGLVAPRMGSAVNMPLESLRALRMARYGRGQETESDRLGQELAARAGYDPAALAPILARMERVGAVMVGSTRRPSFFDTHPATPTRVDEVRSHAAGLTRASRPAAARSDAEFVRALDGLVWGENPAHGEFRDAVFVDPVLKIAITFPDAWQRTLTAQFVGATSRDRKAAAVFSIAAVGERDLDPHVEAGRRRMREDGFEQVADEVIEAHGREVRILEFRSQRGSEVALLAWFDLGGAIGEFLALGPSSTQPLLRETVQSLRPLTARERASFTVERIRIVEAGEGENLVGLMTRVRAVAALDLTAALNDLELDARLVRGQLVKILRVEPFVPGDRPD